MKNYISSEVAQKTFFCFKVSAIFSNFCETFCSTEWFQQQQESTNEIESMAEKPKWGERKWRIIFRRRESVAMVAKFLNDNKPKTSQKWIRTLSNFVDLIQFQFICSLILLGKFSEVESGRTVSKCRKRKWEILCFFHYSKQRASKEVSCGSRATTAKKCTKKAWCACKVVVLLL